MKKTVIIILVLMLSSCIAENEVKNLYEPVSEFTFDGSLFVNEQIKFINKSEFADSYVWSFGDGRVSENENPEHFYMDDGVYTVVLTAKYKNMQAVYSQSLRISNKSIKYE